MTTKTISAPLEPSWWPNARAEEHAWLHPYDAPERSAGWGVGDWHCRCGWYGNHGWMGYAGHLEDVIAALRAAARP